MKVELMTNPRVSDSAIEGIARELTKRLMPSIGAHFRNSVKCCPNCENFDGGMERCRLNDKRPPAAVIAFGCECFVDNDLPF